MNVKHKRNGRPIATDPRRRSMRLRMTDEEFNTLTNVSKAMGLSKSEIIRRALELYYRA